MSDGALVLLLALELEHQYFFAAPVGGNGALHARAADGRSGFHRVAIHHGHNSVEFDLRANVARECFDFHRFARRDAILFTAGFYDCVHTYPLKDVGWKLQITT